MSDETKPKLIVQPSLGVEGVMSIPDMGRPHYDGPPQLCNFDITTPSGLRRYLTAAGDSELLASDLDGEVFALVYWMAEPATFLNEESGNIVTGVRVVLWDHEERRLTTTSWAIARYLDRIVKAMGQGPWNPPIGLHIKNKIRRDSKRSYEIKMVELPAVEVTSMGKK